ncbi:hypothetical protein CCP2SC5_1020026 [Azospirillaceae bacterium]
MFLGSADSAPQKRQNQSREQFLGNTPDASGDYRTVALRAVTVRLRLDLNLTTPTGCAHPRNNGRRRGRERRGKRRERIIWRQHYLLIIAPYANGGGGGDAGDTGAPSVGGSVTVMVRQFQSVLPLERAAEPHIKTHRTIITAVMEDHLHSAAAAETKSELRERRRLRTLDLVDRVAPEPLEIDRAEEAPLGDLSVLTLVLRARPMHMPWAPGAPEERAEQGPMLEPERQE